LTKSATTIFNGIVMSQDCLLGYSARAVSQLKLKARHPTMVVIDAGTLYWVFSTIF
jgi:hypothetical protein